MNGMVWVGVCDTNMKIQQTSTRHLFLRGYASFQGVGVNVPRVVLLIGWWKKREEGGTQCRADASSSSRSRRRRSRRRRRANCGCV